MKSIKTLSKSHWVALLFAISITGCSSKNNNNISQVSQSEERQGLWERVGYGNVMDINSQGATLYQYTRASCLKVEAISDDDVDEIFLNAGLSTTDDSDSVAQPTIHLERIETLPATCLDDRLITEVTPTTTFEHFWHTFNDHYAFFEERGVDWNAIYTEAKPQVHDDMDDEELFELLASMLEPIDDGHINLDSDDDEYNPESYKGANRVIIETFEQQSEYDDIQEYAGALSQKYNENLLAYFDEGSKKEAEDIYWATINNSIGYLRIKSMVNEGDTPAEDVAAIKTVMDQAMSDLKDTESLMIDVRNNEGGYDEVSLAIAEYFISQRQLAVSKKARSWQGETNPIEFYINPAMDTPYLKPVAIIAGPATASAAEIFLMAMHSMPQVTLVGENSNGALSDMLFKGLANEWESTLSNEMYMDSQGVNYEVIGVTPDVEAPIFSISAINQGRNAAIDAALQTLGH